MRVVAFVLAALLVHQLLGVLPLVGGLVRGLPLIGLLLAVLVTAAGARALERTLLERRRTAAELRQLGAVDTPNARGKLGAALLARGRAKEALEHLEVARAGEPERIEWSYRLAQARMAVGDADGARRELEDTVAADEEYAYGEALLELAELRLGAGEAEGGLAAAERAARNHGPSPRSACLRGEALRALGRRDEARAAFDEALELSRSVPAFQKGEARRWVRRARRAR